MDAADQYDPDQADNADGSDLVRESQ